MIKRSGVSESCTHRSKSPETFWNFLGGREIWVGLVEKAVKGSGLTLCFLRLQSLEGFPSEFGEFINRKTNSWHVLYLLCLSQGFNINFPTWKALRPRRHFVSSGPQLQCAGTMPPPGLGKVGTSPPDAVKTVDSTHTVSLFQGRLGK
jgi:hypothetical protein